MRPTSIGTLSAVGALTLGSIASSASASFLFSQITDNGNENVANQFVLDVIDHGSEVGLKVTNLGPIASTIAGFYVDDDNGRFSAITDYVGTGSVSFGPPPPGPDDLPNGGIVGFATDFTATADPPPATNGVDPGEMFELKLSLTGGATATDVVHDLSSGAMAVGLHVVSIGTVGGSESFVTQPFIPTPGTIVLSACAFGCVSLRRRKRR